MSDPILRLERDGRVLTVWIHSPPYNWLDFRLVDELDALGRRLKGDRTIGAVVLASDVPGAWITHAKIEELSEGARGVGPPPPRAAARLALGVAGAADRVPPLRKALARTPAGGLLQLRRAGDALRRLGRLDQVVIAAIDGNAMGGGFEVAMACDLRVVADGDFHLGFVEGAVGLGTGTGGAQRMARTIGFGPAMELLLEARYLTPSEVFDLRLASRLVPSGEAAGQAQALARRLAARQPETVGAIKRALFDGFSRPLAQAIAIERATYATIAPRAGTLRAGDELARRLAAISPGRYSAPEVWDTLIDGSAVDMIDQSD